MLHKTKYPILLRWSKSKYLKLRIFSNQKSTLFHIAFRYIYFHKHQSLKSVPFFCLFLFIFSTILSCDLVHRRVTILFFSFLFSRHWMLHGGSDYFHWEGLSATLYVPRHMIKDLAYWERRNLVFPRTYLRREHRLDQLEFPLAYQILFTDFAND